MKFKAPNSSPALVCNSRAGFTLAEVLAAMLFMAIVIPVSIQGLRVAGTAGEVAVRKGQAARIAELVLNRVLTSTNTIPSTENGKVVEGTREFEYRVTTGLWNQQVTNQVPANAAGAGQLTVTQPQVNTMAASQVSLSMLTVEVDYLVQGKTYTFRLDTLTDSQR